MHLYAYGQFCKNYHDAQFEPLWLFFSKPNSFIFSPRSQEHIKVSNLVFAKLAEQFSNYYNKHAKMEGDIRIKIIPFLFCNPTSIIWQTRAMYGSY